MYLMSKRKKGLCRVLRDKKLKNKLEKNALFHPLSCIGAILVKQMSVYTHHKKLHYQSFTHKEKNSVKFEAERFLWIYFWKLLQCVVQKV